MTIDVDELETLAERAELLVAEVRALTIDDPNPIVAHAATTLEGGASGLRRALAKLSARAARDAQRSVVREVQKAQREHDPLVAELAAIRGISYDEMAAIQAEAKARHRQTIARGSFEEQLAAAAAAGETDGS